MMLQQIIFHSIEAGAYNSYLLVEQLINWLATAVVEALEALAASTAQVCAMSQAQVLAALQEVIQSIAEFSVTSSGDHADVLEIHNFASI